MSALLEVETTTCHRWTDVDHLLRCLVDPGRKNPIVLVTRPNDGSGFLVDLPEFISQLPSEVSLYLLPTPESTHILSAGLRARGMSDRLSCYNGGIRTYLPDFPRGGETAHPLMVPWRIRRMLEKDGLASVIWNLRLNASPDTRLTHGLCDDSSKNSIRRLREKLASTGSSGEARNSKHTDSLVVMSVSRSYVAKDSSEPRFVDVTVDPVVAREPPQSTSASHDDREPVSEHSGSVEVEKAVGPVEPAEPVEPSSRTNRAISPEFAESTELTEFASCSGSATEEIAFPLKVENLFDEIKLEFAVLMEKISTYESQQRAWVKEREGLLSQVQVLQEKVKSNDALASNSKRLRKCPAQYVDSFMAEVYREQVVILPRAWQMPKGNGAIPRTRLGRLFPLLAEFGLNDLKLSAVLEETFGKAVRFRPHDSPETTERFGEKRMFVRGDGKRCLCKRHVTIGRRESATWQVYYFVRCGMIEVAYIGPHLPTVSYL